MDKIQDTIINVMQDLAAKKIAGNKDNPEVVLKKTLTRKELKHIKLNYFRKGILGLYVDSSSWLYSFTLQKETLLQKLRRELVSIKDIRFRIGEIK